LSLLHILPLRLRRTLFLGFLFLAWLRDVLTDRCKLHDWWRDFWCRMGFIPHHVPRSIWVHGEGLGEFHASEPLIHEIRCLCPNHRIVYTTSHHRTVRWLQEKYFADISLPLPWDLSFAIRLWFRRLNPELLILLEYHDGFCSQALTHARQRQTPIV